MPVDPKLIPYPEHAPVKKKTNYALLRLLGKVLWTLTLGFIGATILFFLFFNWKGEAFIEKKLSKIFDAPVNVEYLRILVPFGLAWDDMTVGDVFKAKEIRIFLGWPNVFAREFHVAKALVVEPELTIVIPPRQEATFVPEPQAEVPAEADVSADDAVEKQPARLVIESLVVHRASLAVINPTPEKAFQVYLSDGEAWLKNFEYPQTERNTDFSLKAIVVKSSWPVKGSLIELSGWYQWPQRNLNADLRLDPAEKGFALTANANAMANECTVSGNIKMADMMEDLTPKSESSGGKLDFQSMFIQAIQASGVEVDARFQFKTSLDNFEIGAISFSGNMGYNVPPNLEKKAEAPVSTVTEAVPEIAPPAVVNAEN